MSLETLENIVKSGKKLTPMMEQYFSIKKQYSDTLLLFRMGDFYELFFEDAVNASRILNITLTHRGKIGDTKIPMAGIPHHAASAYIDKIAASGIKAAICEQVEDPKQSKGIVKRAVTQVVSPGMPFDLEKTSTKEHRYISSAYVCNNIFYLASIDFTTGDFSGHKITSEEELLERLRLVSPKELVTYMGQWEEYPLIKDFYNKESILKTHLAVDYFDAKFTSIYIEKFIPSYKRDSVLKQEPEILSAIGSLAYYVSSTQASESFVHIKSFRLESNAREMKVTLPTLTGLEILPKSRDRYNESLLGFFDKCQTSMGSRYLKKVFITPSRSINEIKSRQDFIQFFIDNECTLSDIRSLLNDIRDIERIMAKVSTKKTTPSDLINLSLAIKNYTEIQSILGGFNIELKKFLTLKTIKELSKISKTIDKTINDEIGASLDKGNLIIEGCNNERDRLAGLSSNWFQALIELENKYKKETGIPKLKIKSNNVAGYFIEISKIHSDKVPSSFVRRQTLVNSERYVTEELNSFEKEVVTAKDQLERLERKILNEIIDSVSNCSSNILDLAEVISHIDVFQGLSWVAVQEGLSRPNIDESKKILKITGGWHPLIKASIRDQFVAHDITLDNNKYFGLITGPNMAGKTTVMREVAIIQLLTQIGSYIPAQSAELGLCDYLFSRLGASDDILKGQSTFMVEMSETAEIIRHATDSSLIILDEVGRGTSTYDGLSIAWSLVEHFIKETKALTLFATHYHELIDLIDNNKNAKNLTVETLNENGNVQFLYNLIEEGASQSYGIYVAKLAGLPNSILDRSQSILEKLEEDHMTANSKTIVDESLKEKKVVENNIDPDALHKEKEAEMQLSFFSEPIVEKVEIPKYLKDLEKDISKLDIMNMTPIQALNKLDKLKSNISSVVQ